MEKEKLTIEDIKSLGWYNDTSNPNSFWINQKGTEEGNMMLMFYPKKSKIDISYNMLKFPGIQLQYSVSDFTVYNKEELKFVMRRIGLKIIDKSKR